MSNPFARPLKAALFCCALGMAQLAGATAFSTNYSDLWWNPNESGWGVNVTQQDDTLFATFFVYTLDNKAHWYISTLRFQSLGTDGSPTFGGGVFETTGPWFGGTFNPTDVTIQNVGTATFKGIGATRATLQYSVRGVGTTKQIERQTLRANSMAGLYLGGTSDITFGCTIPSRNNLLTEDGGGITITQNASLVTIRTPTCTFTGTYEQKGQVGAMDSAYQCTTGATGTASFSELYVETTGITGRYTGKGDGCNFVGNIGGARRK